MLAITCAFRMTQRGAANALNKCGLAKSEVCSPMQRFSTSTATTEKAEDMLVCGKDEGAKKGACDMLDLTIPFPGYFFLGPCRPPCEDPVLRCPPKGQPIKKVKCCYIERSKSWRDPCMFVDHCEPCEPPPKPKPKC